MHAVISCCGFRRRVGVAGHADDSDAVRLSASELRNVWRTCDVSGRARAAKVHCINEQAEKLVRGKAIQRTNARSEEVTRQQVGRGALRVGASRR